MPAIKTELGECKLNNQRQTIASVDPPERLPELEDALPILPRQALLYRLRGPGIRCGARVSACTGPRTYGAACKPNVDTILDETGAVPRRAVRGRGVPHTE